MSELDKLFGDFESKKKKEQETIDAERQQEEVLRKASTQVLRNIVLPVINEISASIRKNGHEAKVLERFENFSSPSLELSFTPTLKGESHTYISASTLTFIHSKGGKIKVRQKVESKDGKNTGFASSHYGSDPTVEPSSLTEDQVRSQIVTFVEAVLQAN